MPSCTLFPFFPSGPTNCFLRFYYMSWLDNRHWNHLKLFNVSIKYGRLFVHSKFFTLSCNFKFFKKKIYFGIHYPLSNTFAWAKKGHVKSLNWYHLEVSFNNKNFSIHLFINFSFFQSRKQKKIPLNTNSSILMRYNFSFYLFLLITA